MHKPRIVSEKVVPLSPWVKIVERAVEFEPGRAPEIYHSVGQADYVAMLAITPEGNIPIVRQFRPAWGDCTWELPAGLVDPGETPESSCIRELREETGFIARQVYFLGTNAPCTSRLSNRLHSFFVEADSPHPGFKVEPGLEVKNVTRQKLLQMIITGEFPLQLHIGVILRAAIDPIVGPKLCLKVRPES